MMPKFSSWSIRTHLAILIAFLAFPCILATVHFGMAERREATYRAKEDQLDFVNTVAAQQKAVFEGARQFMTVLSSLPQLQSGNSSAVSALLSDLIKKCPQYGSIVVLDRSGFVWASALPLKEKVWLGDRKHFKDAVRTGEFSSGEYVVGRFCKKHSFHFAYPVKNADGKLVAVTIVALDLEYARNMLIRLNLSPGSTLTLLDHRGVILLSHPGSTVLGRPTGEFDRRKELFIKMASGPEEGTFEAVGNDGTPRLYAYRKLKLSHESEPYLYIRSNIPLGPVTSKANAALRRNVALMVAVFLAGLLLIWLLGKRTIVNPLMALKNASERLAAGNDTVSISPLARGGELAQLARSFDSMAEALRQRENALRQSEERYRLLIETANEGIWSMDGEHVTTYVNQAMADMMGYSPSEMVRKKVEDFFFQEDMAFHGERMKMRHSGEDEVYERRFRRRDGSALWTLVSAKALRDNEGSFAGSFAMFTDITERKQAQEALRESEEKYKTVADFTYDWETWMDPGGQYKYVSPSCERITGYTPDEFIKNPGLMNTVTHPEDIGSVRDHFIIITTAPGTCHFEFRILTKAGEERWISHFCQPIYDQDGNFIGRRASNRDITSRKQALDALKESEERFRGIANNLPGMVFQWYARDNGERGMYFVDKRSEEVYGVSVDPIETWPERFDACIAPEDRERWLDSIEEVVRTGSPWDIEARIINPAGEEMYVKGLARPKRMGHELVSNGLLIDITERKRIEETLRQREFFLNTLLNAIPIPVFYKDIDGRFLGINRAYEGFFGAAKEQVTGKTVFELNPPELAEIYHCKDAELLERGGIQQYQSQLKDLRGVLHDVVFDKAVFTDSDGTIRGLIGAILDITSQKRAGRKKSRPRSGKRKSSSRKSITG